MNTWTEAFPADLPEGGVRVFRHDAGQVAVFHTAAGWYAIDNVCPHEGYPLDKGEARGCVVTCCWHNFKFDVRDGSCLKGDEAVRTFPLELRDGAVWLDLAEPDRSAQIPGLWTSLEEAVLDRRMGQVARDVVRLLQAGVEPVELALRCAALDARHGKYGSGHGLPVAVDALALCERYGGLRAAVPLVHAFDVAAESIVRRPERVWAEPVRVENAVEEVRRAVEAEDAERAEAVLLGALHLGPAVWEPAFLQLCADHFLSFGHGLIFVTKAFDLLRDRWEHAPQILPGLLFSVVNGTREEQIPGQRKWAGRLEELRPRYAGWLDGTGPATLNLDGRASDWFDSLVEALDGGASLEAVVDGISRHAAERMLRFDVAIDRSDDLQDTWLYVTHVQTFANAVRHAVRRWRSPDVVRLLFFAAHFSWKTRALDGPETSIVPASGDLAEALRFKRPEALAIAAGTEADVLKTALIEASLDRPAVLPIVVAHAIKNTVVAVEEFDATGDRAFLLAATRFLASPVTERSTRRTIEEALAFVSQGKKPKTRAG